MAFARKQEKPIAGMESVMSTIFELADNAPKMVIDVRELQ
jgi:hypothetical protein